MCDLMRYRVGKIVVKVFTEQIRIVADLLLLPAHPEHPCYATAQVKADTRQQEVTLEQLLCPLNTFTGRSDNLILL